MQLKQAEFKKWPLVFWGENKMRVKARLLELLMITIIISGFLMTANAEESPPLTPETTERIEVTGSHIKRIDVEGVSPVQTISHQDLEKKGYDNLGDVVKDLGLNSFGGETISGNSTEPGNAEINLRGLGADNTLVLLNGQRLPQDAVSGRVDLNIVPMAAVDRIEILKDGASAIYGSDALGGVVNIITRHDFQGTQVTLTQHVPTQFSDGKKTNVTLVNGINGEKFNIVTAIGYHYDQAIFSKNRNWSDHSFSTLGSPAAYANEDSSQNVGTWYASPNCPASLLLSSPSGTRCQYKYSDYSLEAPRISQIGGLSEAHYEVSSGLRLTARASVVHRDAQTIAAPAPGEIQIPASAVAQFGLPNIVPGQALDISTRITAAGPRVTNVQTNSFGGLLGATIQMPADWQLEITTNYNLIKNDLKGTSGYILAGPLADLAAAGAYNPFAPIGSQGNISAANYTPYENTTSLLMGLEVKSSGTLTELPAGPLSLATGTLINFASYNDDSDSQTIAGNVLGNAGSSGAGHRTSEAIYSELSIPLITKILEVQLAGRYDHYSDFGGTVNPKLGVLLHASPSLLFRGTVSTGFRSPLLSELYAGQSQDFPTFIDAVYCNAHPGTSACKARQYQTTSGGNPNLKQETSVSYSMGAVYEPIKAFNFGTDFYYTKIKNVPGIDYNDMTLAESKGVNLGKYGVSTVRNSNGELHSVNAPLQNLSEEQVAGVDITSSYSFDRFKLSTDQNQLFFFKEGGFPELSVVDKLGWKGRPAWRNTSTLSYFISDLQNASLSGRTIPHQKTLDKSGQISSLTTFDASYIRKMGTLGTISISLINLFNAEAPQDASNPGERVNYQLYDPNGRQVVLAYKKDW